jgi:hypothetical protein
MNRGEGCLPSPQVRHCPHSQCISQLVYRKKKIVLWCRRYTSFFKKCAKSIERNPRGFVLKKSAKWTNGPLLAFKVYPPPPPPTWLLTMHSIDLSKLKTFQAKYKSLFRVLPFYLCLDKNQEKSLRYCFFMSRLGFGSELPQYICRYSVQHDPDPKNCILVWF